MANLLSIGALTKPWQSCPVHQHDCWEFVIYTRGEGVATIGEQPIAFTPGTIICMPPRIPHREHAPRGYTNIHMSIARYAARGAEVPVFNDDANQSFLHVAQLLHREFHLRHARWQLICQDLCALLLRYLERWSDAGSSAPLVDRIKNLLLGGLADGDFSVGDALATLPCSADHARRIFLAATGITPKRYLADLRVHEAKQLLASGCTVGEAAAHVGMDDPYYFSRMFRKHAGASPSRWLAEQGE